MSLCVCVSVCGQYVWPEAWPLWDMFVEDEGACPTLLLPAGCGSLTSDVVYLVFHDDLTWLLTRSPGDCGLGWLGPLLCGLERGVFTRWFLVSLGQKSPFVIVWGSLVLIELAACISWKPPSVLKSTVVAGKLECDTNIVFFCQFTLTCCQSTFKPHPVR